MMVLELNQNTVNKFILPNGLTKAELGRHSFGKTFR